VGIAIIIIFVSIAVLASKLTPYDPIKSKFLAEAVAAPQWATIFPSYRDLPPTTEIPANWDVKQGSSFVHVELSTGLAVVRYSGEMEKDDIYLEAIFLYPYSPPMTFSYQFSWTAEEVKRMNYALELTLVNEQTGTSYSLWDSYYGYNVKRTPEIPPLTKDVNSTSVKADSWSTSELQSRLQLRPGYAKTIFSEKGEYYLLMHIVFEPTSENATCEISLKDTKITIPGMVWGILGTNHLGGDIFCELVYGTQTSLIIGVSAAFFMTAIGTVVGVVAGYAGGIVDEFLMRITDIMLCMPMLPLLITLAFVFGRSLLLLVLMMSALYWTYEARIIRSRVLSLREMAFVESAQAAGASNTYIVLRHMIPNVLPIAFAAMVLNVPSAIVSEAVISFIGLGDPTLPTWGKTLQYAFHSGGFEKLAWWWIIPPGLALMILSLGFVFIGHAVDEIVNPRLRRRR